MVDYIFRWLGIEFLPGYREANTPKREEESAEGDSADENPKPMGAKSRSVVRDLKTAVGNGSNVKQYSGHSRVAFESDGLAARSAEFARFQADAPACDNCGAITVRNGNCYLCHNCGNSMGCS